MRIEIINTGSEVLVTTYVISRSNRDDFVNLMIILLNGCRSLLLALASVVAVLLREWAVDNRWQ
jgi:hypothetical protein